MDDDLMPNDGTFLGGVPLEPRDQIIERKKDRAKTLEALKITETLIAHFDERIALRDRLDAIQNVDIETNAEDFLRAVLVNKLLKQALEEEKELLIEKIELYGPK